MTERWGIPVPLFEDEILSSWLVRNALMFGCEPLVLTGELWPRVRVWTHDLDRGLSPEMMKVLEAVSGISVARLRAATLQPTAEVVADGDPGEAVWPWITVIGSRNRRRRGGMQYCPVCLRDDRQPYYRQQWRLAWHVGCPAHGCLLHMACPHCGASVEYQRLVPFSGRMDACASCGGLLSDAAAQPVAKEALAFQAVADGIGKERRYAWGTWEVSSADWFALARRFVVILRKAAMRKPTHMGPRFCFGAGIPSRAVIKTQSRLPLEFLPAGERAALFEGVWRFLSLGPEGVIECAHRTGFTRKALLVDCHGRFPSLVLRLADAMPAGKAIERARPEATDRPPGPRSPREVKEMWARLRRKAGLGPS